MPSLKFIAIFILGLFLQIGPLSAEENKIVYTIAVPRSLGTAFLRTFESRPDFQVFNEPTNPIYVHLKNPSLSQQIYLPSSFQSFEEFKISLFQDLKKSNLMVKDLSFAFYPLAKEDPSFLSDPKIHFVFLLRNPHSSSISFYLKQEAENNCEDFTFNEERFSRLIGFKNLYETYQEVLKHSPNKVTILFAEDLAENPQKTLSNLCASLNIPFLDSSLSFTPYTADFSGTTWHEAKKDHEHFLNWHGEAAMSSSIHICSSYDVDVEQNPTFKEITNLEHQKKVKQAYEEALPYYQFFKEEAKRLALLKDDSTPSPKECSLQ